jgi:exo-beta-1,3-glucanase (GH17 family)
MGRVNLSCAAIIALNAFALLEAFKVSPALGKCSANIQIECHAVLSVADSKTMIVTSFGSPSEGDTDKNPSHGSC